MRAFLDPESDEELFGKLDGDETGKAAFITEEMVLQALFTWRVAAYSQLWLSVMQSVSPYLPERLKK